MEAMLILTTFQGSVYALPEEAAGISSTSLSSGTTTNLATQTPARIRPYTTTPGTTGSVITSPETLGEPSVQPFPTSTQAGTTGTFSLTGSLSLATGDSAHKGVALKAAMTVPDIFQPIATTNLPSQVTSRGDHPVPKLGIAFQNNPISTNKFYANLFLGTQGQGAWTHPYSVTWCKGTGNAESWGMCISHIDADQQAYGPQQTTIPGSPVQYFINPIGIQSMILSAAEFGPSTVLTTDTLQAFSANANLGPKIGSESKLTLPLVQGMGFVTGIYTNLCPAIQSSVFFRTVVSAGSPKAGVFKYRITLEDGKSWLLYATASTGRDPSLKLVSNTLLQGPSGWSGTIQIAKNPAGSGGESLYDGSAGVYATTGQVNGSVQEAMGTYQVQWTKGGLTANPLLMFALPHHLQSFDSNTTSGVTSIQLQTSTKGMATAVIANSWILVEPNLPTDMGFAPWSPTVGSATTLSAAAIQAVVKAGSNEINQDMNAQSNLDSMYYSGKALSKFAMIIYTLHDLAHQPDLAAQGLTSLKAAFSRFTNNNQIYPLVYDSIWGGVVSVGSYRTGDSGQDFGNTYYNDHHFHYGYFVHAAAVIGYLDPSWVAPNRDWVNMLVRDVANPSTQDNYFPFSRNFDWYHGHSFAKGLFESGDSKDEESSSEDVMFAYGMKMWGQIVGDAAMEARGNLMLSILARSLRNYFLMQSDNVNQPANFIGNKVTGILFENKIDHTTYFGANLEYVQGIHMIPLTPASALTRTQQFVSEEWSTYFANGAVDPAANVVGGWKGILYANLAIIDPKASFSFFSQSNFDSSWLDGGASQTWYLAYAAGLGGA